MYKPDFDYSYIIELLQKYHFSKVRTSISVPNETKYIKNPINYFEIIKPRVLEFYEALSAINVAPFFDCNSMPGCVWTQEERNEALAEFPGANKITNIFNTTVSCHPVIDILPDLSIIRYFGLSEYTRRQISDFENINDAMENNCKGDQKSAFRFVDKMDISYDTFYNDCCAMQKRIMNCNGNFIGICLKPSYYWIVAYFGVQLSGKTAVLIDESKEETEINHICKRYSVSELITDENIEIHSNRINTLLKKVKDTTEISTIIFTSGTEGISKGVALSAKGIITSTYDSLNTIEINKDDVIIHTLPFFHGFGLAAEVVATIMKKSTLCFGKSLGRLPDDIVYFSATVLFCVPQIEKKLHHI